MRCGLLGRSLGHSWSPQIHGLLADYSYELFPREPEAVEGFVKHGPWDGCNVTIPYKKTVIPFCDVLTPLAQELGSVNTLVRLPNGQIMGDNTDAWGFDQLLGRVGVSCRGKKALVFGSGGASATAQAVLKLAGASVVVISRQGKDNYENLNLHGDAAILVNTTPVGMYPNCGESVADLEQFPNARAVLDVIYNPVRTKLILDAEERGIPCENGLYMLVAQAARASELWTGVCVSAEKAEQIYRSIGRAMGNLVLIGMPGCGKSTVGFRLARETGRWFVDADQEFTKQLGISPADYIRRFGEDAFRQEETKVLSQLGKGSGLVIATGGGAVTRRENYRHLHQNGTIIWLQRALSALSVAERPLSQATGVEELYARRKPLYEAFADLCVENTDAEETVKKIIGLI